MTNKRRCFLCYLLTFLYITILFWQDWSYYFTPPSLETLFRIEGVIIKDNRKKNNLDREDGIFIQQLSGEKLKIYCDNPTKPLYKPIKPSSPYNLGDCYWISILEKRNGLCNKTACVNPRELYGKYAIALVDKNNTIYKLNIDGREFYSYMKMVNLYRNRFLKTNISFFVFFLVILFIFYKHK